MNYKSRIFPENSPDLLRAVKVNALNSICFISGHRNIIPTELACADKKIIAMAVAHNGPVILLKVTL